MCVKLTTIGIIENKIHRICPSLYVSRLWFCADEYRTGRPDVLKPATPGSIAVVVKLLALHWPFAFMAYEDDTAYDAVPDNEAVILINLASLPLIGCKNCTYFNIFYKSYTAFNVTFPIVTELLFEASPPLVTNLNVTICFEPDTIATLSPSLDPTESIATDGRLAGFADR